MNLLALPFPQIDPVALSLGPVEVRWYGLAYFVGILIGWWYARRLIRNDRLWHGGSAPFSATDLDDFILWGTLGIILGGRLGYAIFYEPGHYLENPLAFFRLWEGGMAFHGGLTGIVLAMIGFAWKRGFSALSLFDIIAAAVPFGLFFGRIANFINGELFGRVSYVPWAMVFPAGGPLPRHPSQLYEAALEGLLMFLILRLMTNHMRSLRFPGLTGGTFLALYGSFRIFAEFFRQPDPQLGFIASFLTMGMILSIPMILAGLGGIAWALARRRPENEPGAQ